MRNVLLLMTITFVVAVFFGMKHGKEKKVERMRVAMVHGCQDGYTAQGIPGDTAQSLCGCVVDKLIKDHGFEELDKVMDEEVSQQPPWVRKEGVANAQQCATSLHLQVSVSMP